MRNRLFWLIASRLIITIILSVIAAALHISSPAGLIRSSSIIPVVICLLSVLYWIGLRLLNNHSLQAHLQLIVDTLLVAWLIHSSGGIQSPFSALYLVTIFIASALLARRSIYAISILSALLYSALIAFGHGPAVTQDSPSFVGDLLPRDVLFRVILNLFAIFVVAILSSQLSERLRHSAAQLATTARSLANLRAFNERIIDSIHSGLVTIDLAGNIITFNRAAEEITGYRFTQVSGSPLNIVFGDLTEQIQLSMAAIERGNRPPRLEMDARTADGRAIHLGFSIALLVGESGERTGYVIAFQDLTEVVKLEREMRRQDRLVALGKMAAAIAHEIRNPLASMRGSVQLLQSELNLTEEQNHLMNIVIRESDRLNQIISDFLSYARPAPSRPVLIDLKQELAETVKLLRNSPEVTDKQVIIERYPPGPVIYRADSNQMRQVFWNLTRNCLQAMPDGGSLVISLKIAEGNQIEVTFKDTGIGMNEEQVERIFEPFNSYRRGGTGLGMAIVYQIISDHNGRIFVDSQPGKGTSVTILLPEISRQEQSLNYAETESLAVSYR